MKLLICGKSGAGKTYLAKKLQSERGLKLAISYTSRPIRDGEVDGVDYRFTDDATMISMNNNAEFVEFNSFNGHYYGYTKDEILTSDIIIMTPDKIQEIADYLIANNIRYLVLEVSTPESIRRSRMKEERGWDDAKINVRISEDERVFSNVKVDLIIPGY